MIFVLFICAVYTSQRRTHLPSSCGRGFRRGPFDLIDPDSITVTSTSGDPDDPLKQFDHVDVTFAFSSQGKTNPAPADIFAFELPEIFQPAMLTFELEHPDGTVLATCELNGGLGAAVTFILDGETVPVDLPGEGGVIP